MKWDILIGLVLLAAAAVANVTREERRSVKTLYEIGYLPCEHCGVRSYTTLREPTKGETIRLCTKCGIHLLRAGSQR